MRLPPKPIRDLALKLRHSVPTQSRTREFSREGRLERPISPALAAKQAAVRVGPTSVAVCGEFLKISKGGDMLLGPVAHSSISPFGFHGRTPSLGPRIP